MPLLQRSSTIGWSPLKYQSNRGPTSSFSSAMKPSTETTACITTVNPPHQPAMCPCASVIASSTPYVANALRSTRSV